MDYTTIGVEETLPTLVIGVILQPRQQALTRGLQPAGHPADLPDLPNCCGLAPHFNLPFARRFET
jgi:hypothetical protein